MRTFSSGEPEQGRTGGLRPSTSRTRLSTRQRPRRAPKEAEGDTVTTRKAGPIMAVTKQAGASTGGTEGLPDAGERIRIRRSDRRPGRLKERARLPHRS